MILRNDDGFYAEDFNGYLDSKRKDFIRKSEHPEWRKTYLWHPEDLSEEEEKEFPGSKCVCFRITGYTIGHMIVNTNNKNIIQRIVIYPVEEDVNCFELTCADLEKDLNEKYLGKELK